MNRHQTILLVLLAFVLGACAGTQITAVERQTVDVDGAYTVDPQITWSEFQGASIASNGHVWTVDGLFLQRLDLFGGIEPGEALFEPAGAEEESLPKFQDDMRASDIQEFVIASLTQLGYVDVEAMGLRPAEIGGNDGFRFELSMATQSGLEMKGMAAGVNMAVWPSGVCQMRRPRPSSTSYCSPNRCWRW